MAHYLAIVVWHARGRGAFVDFLWVDAAHRKRGIGRALLGRIARDHEFVELIVSKSNTIALKAYGRLGFGSTADGKRLPAALYAPFESELALRAYAIDVNDMRLDVTCFDAWDALPACARSAVVTAARETTSSHSAARHVVDPSESRERLRYMFVVSASPSKKVRGCTKRLSSDGDSVLGCLLDGEREGGRDAQGRDDFDEVSGRHDPVWSCPLHDVVQDDARQSDRQDSGARHAAGAQAQQQHV